MSWVRTGRQCRRWGQPYIEDYDDLPLYAYRFVSKDLSLGPRFALPEAKEKDCRWRPEGTTAAPAALQWCPTGGFDTWAPRLERRATVRFPAAE